MARCWRESLRAPGSARAHVCPRPVTLPDGTSRLPPSKASSTSAAPSLDCGDARLEHTPESNGLAKPGQIGTAHQLGQRARAMARPCSSISTCVAEAHDVVEVVGHEHDRNVERRAQFVDLILQLAPHRTIDGGKRFIEQQHRGLARECPRQRHPLALAAGELARVPVAAISDR